MAITLPDILHLKSEEVDTPEKRGKYTASLVGCGQKGVFYALAFAEAGFKVICTDADQSVVKRLSKGNMQLGDREAEAKLKNFVRTEKIYVTSDLKTAVSGSNIIVITVNTKIDAKKSSDCSALEGTCKQVGAALPKGSLVVYVGVAGFGFTENIVKETLENTSGLKAGEDFGISYSFITNSNGSSERQIEGKELTVAAYDKISLNSTALIFETIAKKGVRRISDVKMAELAALFAAAKRDANVALANELAIFCESAGLDYAETLKLLENGASEMNQVPTISEENNRNEVYLLLESAENLNTKLRLLTLARQVNEEMIRHAINLTQDALRSGGKTLRRAKVALLGTVELGTADAAFIEFLEAKGAKVSRYDPYRSESESSSSLSSIKKTLNETVEGTDCVIILSEQEQLKRLNLKKLHAIMKSPAALVDLAGIVEPNKVKTEGFTYRGLGRGAWKK
jgi:UDP-N-acetyl-D-mannosaminuronic acid dehydrogenase